MTTTTIQNKIYTNIINRLGNISIASGYFNDINAVKKSPTLNPQENDIPIIYCWLLDDTVIERAFYHEVRQLSIGLTAFIHSSDIPYSDLVYKLSCDIMTALNRATTAKLVSNSPSFNLGGLVDDLIITSVTPYFRSGGTGICGVMLEINAQYKIEDNNFYVTE
jgi:hypothetical protein